jgi:hypothetical protein
MEKTLWQLFFEFQGKNQANELALEIETLWYQK